MNPKFQYFLLYFRIIGHFIIIGLIRKKNPIIIRQIVDFSEKARQT
jgi:hypothetical protein